MVSSIPFLRHSLVINVSDTWIHSLPIISKLVLLCDKQQGNVPVSDNVGILNCLGKRNQNMNADSKIRNQNSISDSLIFDEYL